LLPFFAISLTACQSAQVQTRLVTLPPPAIPPALLLPIDGPYRPPAWATQRDAAVVIEDFIEALASCNADKDAVAQIFKEYEHGMAGQRD
jgi:hypothetical protein